MVNPPPDLTLKRLEGRLGRIKLALEQNAKVYTPEKKAALTKTSKRLEFEIMLRKGEF